MSLLVKVGWIFKQNSAKPLMASHVWPRSIKTGFRLCWLYRQDVDVLYEEGMTAILEFWPKPNHWKQH